jgi:hypothetical protein
MDEEVVLTLSQNSNWQFLRRPDGKVPARLEPYKVFHDVCLLRRLFLNPRSFQTGGLLKVQMDDIVEFLDTPYLIGVSYYYSLALDPEMHPYYIIYIQLLLLAYWTPTQEMFLNACNQHRLRLFIPYLRLHLSRFMTACHNERNIIPPLHSFLEMMAIPILHSNYQPCHDAAFLFGHDMEAERMIMRVSPEEFIPELFLDKNELLANVQSEITLPFCLPKKQNFPAGDYYDETDERPPISYTADNEMLFYAGPSADGTLPARELDFIKLVTNPHEHAHQMTHDQFMPFIKTFHRDMGQHKGQKAQLELASYMGKLKKKANVPL